MLAANPTFHRAGSQLSPPFETCRNSTEVQRGWGDLIPHEEKWKLINHSTYLFRGGGGFDPLWREVEVNKPFNILVQRRWGIWPLSREVEVNKLFNVFVQGGWGDLIPHEEKWKLIDHSTYLFRGGVDPLWTFDSPVECVPVELKDVSAGYQDCLKAAG